MKGDLRVWPVILSGGVGSRLWPLSRVEQPKQLLPLAGADTMIQATARRVADPARFHPPVVVANAVQAEAIAAQLHAAEEELADITALRRAARASPAARRCDEHRSEGLAGGFLPLGRRRSRDA